MNKKLKITLEIEYDPAGLPVLALRDLADDAINHAVGNGAFTGDTAATIEEWDLRIEEVEIAEPTYKIVRKFFRNHPDEVIAEGLSLAEAREHCSAPETSSSTATGPEAMERTRQMGPWFDVFYKE